MKTGEKSNKNPLKTGLNGLLNGLSNKSRTQTDQAEPKKEENPKPTNPKHRTQAS
jgi:hypothetical protein